MDIVKPEPLILDGRAHYTLTSYDPVSVEIEVPSVTEEDVNGALRLTIMQAGGGPERMHDDAWIREKFDGIHGIAELKTAVRKELQLYSEQMMEQQKMTACASALAQRLMQRVPLDHIARTREAVEAAFYQSLEQSGVNEAMFLAQSGMSHSDLQFVFDQQAKETAEQDAAISAWADNRKLQVTDDEVYQILGIPNLSDVDDIEEARQAARKLKALSVVVAECSCTYRHGISAASSDENGHPHLKLV